MPDDSGNSEPAKVLPHELISGKRGILCSYCTYYKRRLDCRSKSLEHMVDTVILFERNDDDIRFLRANKNRFGSVDELGIFSMSERGPWRSFIAFYYTENGSPPRRRCSGSCF